MLIVFSLFVYVVYTNSCSSLFFHLFARCVSVHLVYYKVNVPVFIKVITFEKIIIMFSIKTVVYDTWVQTAEWWNQLWKAGWKHVFIALIKQAQLNNDSFTVTGFRPKLISRRSSNIFEALNRSRTQVDLKLHVSFELFGCRLFLLFKLPDNFHKTLPRLSSFCAIIRKICNICFLFAHTK